MALAVMLVLTVLVSSAVAYTSSGSRDAGRSRGPHTPGSGSGLREGFRLPAVYQDGPDTEDAGALSGRSGNVSPFRTD
jgi:hypothetical protein